MYIMHALSSKCIFFIVWSLLTVLTGCDGGSNRSNSVDDPSWQGDVEFALRKLSDTHPDLYAGSSESLFKLASEDIRSNINQLDAIGAKIRMAELMALAKDSHTFFNLSGGSVAFHRFPLILWQTSDGWVVVQSTPAYSHLLGSQLTAINGLAIDHVMDKLEPYISHDNDTWLSVKQADYVMIAELLHYLAVIDNPETSLMTFTYPEGHSNSELLALDSSSSQEWITLYDALGVETPLYLKDSRPYWFEYLADSRSLFVQYNQCSEADNLPLAEFGTQLGAYLDSQMVDKLILDLRHNTGGSSALLQPFIKQLAELPESITLFVLIGRHTASSALINAIQIREQTNAVFIGEPSGGKPNHFGELKFFTLPYSKQSIAISSKYFRLMNGDDESLYPDIRIDYRWQDLLKAEDPLLIVAINN